MARSRRARDAGQLRLQVLDALWKRGEATAQDIQHHLEGPKPALTTVATVLQRLEKGGDVTHRLEGRQHVYRPLVTREEVRSTRLKGILQQLFAGDPVSLVAQLIESGDMTRRDIAKVEGLIARHERARRKP